tara:strand:+ start:3041 stop:3520 length:480 start_codon:yes stop_codon:yes gene_type:complete
MTELSELLKNQILFWSLISCITAQLLKIIFNLVLERELRFGIVFQTGGMPSSHSALISALSAGIGWELGFDNPVFALSVGVSLIVMYDASGIRRSAGMQAIEINKISKELNNDKEIFLKESLGHTKLEVVVGSFLGPLITLPGIVYLGSPYDILSMIIN